MSNAILGMIGGQPFYHLCQLWLLPPANHNIPLEFSFIGLRNKFYAIILSGQDRYKYNFGRLFYHF